MQSSYRIVLLMKHLLIDLDKDLSVSSQLPKWNVIYF